MDALRIPVGYVKRPHGIRGDILVVPLTDNPRRFVPGATMWIEGAGEPVTIETVRAHNEGLIVSLAGVTDRNGAEGVAKSRLLIPAAERRELDGGEHWPDELVGLRVVTEAGVELGTVSDVVLGAAQDRLVVTTADGASTEMPFVAALVDEPANGMIVVRPPDGMFSDTQPH